MRSEEILKEILKKIRHSKESFYYLCELIYITIDKLDRAKTEIDRLKIDKNIKSKLKKEIKEILKEAKEIYEELIEIGDEYCDLIQMFKNIKLNS